MNTQNRTIIVILIIVFGIFIFTRSSIAFKDQIIIFITFIGIFATFYGAYLGAKISGNNARELFEKDIKLRDIENHFSANLVVLDKINDSKNKISQIKENIEKGRFYTPYEMKAIYQDIDKVYKMFNDIKKEDIISSSLIINMDFDNLYVYTEKLHEQLPFIGIDKTKEMLGKYYEGNNLDIQPLLWFQYTPNENWICFYNSTTRKVQKVVETSKVIEENIDFFNGIKNKLEEGLVNWVEQYEKMEFKTKDDIYKIYKEVRS